MSHKKYKFVQPESATFAARYCPVIDDEVPTEFERVTATLPRELISPVNENGTVSTKVPPPSAPFSLAK